jgi:hypothetical protein
MSHQASFLAGADAGAMQAAAQDHAAAAAADRDRAQREEQAEREELDRLRRDAERERERVKEAGRRAAAEVSSMAVEMPVVAYPGAPITAAPVVGERPDTGGGAGQFAKDAAGELSGYNDAKRGIEDLGDGDIIGGAFSLAMAWPGAKAIKGVKELGEEAVERVTKEATAEGAEKAARETVPAFKGTPGENLPVYREGDKTQGVIELDGERLRVQSGYGRPSADLPLGLPGFNGNVKAHVDGHVAALMRQRNLDRVELYINQAPCGGPWGCDKMLPRMLPEGSELVVRGPDGSVKIYKGRAD